MSHSRIIHTLGYLGLVSLCLITTPTLAHRIVPKPSASSQAQSASTLSNWELKGAIAAKRGKKGWTASLNWHQNGPNYYQIRLFGPLGGGTVIVEKKGNQITYRDGPKLRTSTNADDLLQQETGIRLPVKNLYYWIRGLPAPGQVQSAQYDASHHLLSLKQGGYTIDYIGYKSVGGFGLPNKVRLQGHGVLIKLVIKRWGR